MVAPTGFSMFPPISFKVSPGQGRQLRDRTEEHRQLPSAARLAAPGSRAPVSPRGLRIASGSSTVAINRRAAIQVGHRTATRAGPEGKRLHLSPVPEAVNGRGRSRRLFSSVLLVEQRLDDMTPPRAIATTNR
jgi:hypothetical protein